MTMPDSAEYWWDVKGYNRKPYKTSYIHLTGRPCNKKYGSETDHWQVVTCRKCRKTAEYLKLSKSKS